MTALTEEWVAARHEKMFVLGATEPVASVLEEVAAASTKELVETGDVTIL